MSRRKAMSEFLVEIEPIASAMREEFPGDVERRVIASPNATLLLPPQSER